MSLDIDIYVSEKDYPVRADGRLVYNPVDDKRRVKVTILNITHNVTDMADHVPVSKELSLYDVMWRPEEHNIVTTTDIVEYLIKAVLYMEKHKKSLEKFKPPNGWGSYDGLLSVVKWYLGACLVWPDSPVEANR